MQPSLPSLKGSLPRQGEQGLSLVRVLTPTDMMHANPAPDKVDGVSAQGNRVS